MQHKQKRSLMNFISVLDRNTMLGRLPYYTKLRSAVEKLYLQRRLSAAGIDLAFVRDQWFYDHFAAAPARINHMARKKLKGEQQRILDFGCGDGIMALGMQLQNPRARVTGVDLHDAHKCLAETAHKQIQLHALPETLQFHQVQAGEKLESAVGKGFDLIYSWSVFEHIARDCLEGIIADFHSILDKDGLVLIQIAPLYYSPFGSHLLGLVDEPWAHLLLDETELRAKVAGRDLTEFRDDQKNLLFTSCSGNDFKQHMLSEYSTLNRIRYRELITLFEEKGFKVAKIRKKLANQRIPSQLLQKVAREDLRTYEVFVAFRKS